MGDMGDIFRDMRRGRQAAAKQQSCIRRSNGLDGPYRSPLVDDAEWQALGLLAEP
jgi:hypothetical protein